MGDSWFLDEVFVKIRGELHYLWRAVDQDGDTIDILVQKRRNKKAAIRFYHKLLKGQSISPRRVTADKLKSYAAAHREVMPSVITVPNNTKTTELSYPMSQLANANGKCVDSSLQAKHNDFLLFMG